MKVAICEVNPAAKDRLPAAKPDASGVGVNYVDAYLEPFRTKLEDGSRVLCRRRGLRLTLQIGDRKGQALLRRLEHGPDVEAILRSALEEVARDLGSEFNEEKGTLFLEV